MINLLCLKFLLEHKVIFHVTFLREKGGDICDDELVDATHDAAVRGAQPQRQAPAAGVRRVRVHRALENKATTRGKKSLCLAGEQVYTSAVALFITLNGFYQEIISIKHKKNT